MVACPLPMKSRDWAHEVGHYDKLIAFVANNRLT